MWKKHSHGKQIKMNREISKLCKEASKPAGLNSSLLMKVNRVKQLDLVLDQVLGPVVYSAGSVLTYLFQAFLMLLIDR